MDPFFLLLAVPLGAGVYLLASASSSARSRIPRTLIGILLVAVPLGGLGYFFSGIGIARARGVGHFYSVPFGGYAVSDSAIIWSLACWTGLVFALMAAVLRKRLRRHD